MNKSDRFNLETILLTITIATVIFLFQHYLIDIPVMQQVCNNNYCYGAGAFP